MALNLEAIGYYIIGGAFVGGTYLLYRKGYFDDLLGGGPTPGPTPCLQKGLCVEGNTWDDTLCKCVPTPTPKPPAATQYAYYAKRKYQCRDNHMTFAFLASQGVRLVNYKIHNDKMIYPSVCNSPGPLTILVAIELGDVQSGAILQSLGFVEYFAPPSEPNPNIPLPNPPSPLPSSNYAMAYVGSAYGHNAYKSYVL